MALLLLIEAALEEAGGEPLALHFEGEDLEGAIYVDEASVEALGLVDAILAQAGCLTIEIEVAGAPEHALP